jgi:DNA polymerase-3 subunit delta
MQLAAAQLPAHLQKGLRPLYTLHGDEPLLIQEAGDALRAAARAQGFTERTVHTVAGAHFDWSEVLAAGGSLSLFAERQIVEIRIPSGKPGKDGSVAIQQLAESARDNDSTLLLFVLPRLDKATRTSAWFVALENGGVTIPIDPVERAALPQWIAQRLQRQGQRVTSGEEGQRTLQFFADRVEGNLLAAHQEVQKLALLYPEGELGFEQVENAVLNVARYDVFKLSEAVLGGQIARAQRMLDGLRAEGEAEVLVHYTLAEDIRALKRVKDAMNAGRPLPLALREARVWGRAGAPVRARAATPERSPDGAVAAGCPCGGRHRQRPQTARLAGQRLAGAAPAGTGCVPGMHDRPTARVGGPSAATAVARPGR